jgi:uncharacterized protein YjbI with pentapeptide repeats
MANPTHVAKLKEGLASWNAWRTNDPKARIDLRTADLQGLVIDGDDRIGADLIGVDLSGANLQRANMPGVDLTGADLQGTDLRRANLAHARLRGANAVGADFSHAALSDADLRDADLTGADLTGAFLFQALISNANLTRAQLNGTILLHADLTDAKFGATTLANLDLSGTHGLSSIIHLLPSDVGCATLWKSRGSVPEEFLRGAGVPHNLLRRLHESIASKDDLILSYHFISHADADKDLALRLQARLSMEEMPAWVVPESLKRGSTGEISMDRVFELSKLYDKLIIVVSEESIETEWLKREIHVARRREHYEFRRILFPIRTIPEEVLGSDDGIGEILRSEYRVHDFSRWKYELSESAFRNLLDDLRTDAIRKAFKDPVDSP